MWIDDKGKYEKIYKNFDKINHFPTECPVCSRKSLHIYMHIYDDLTKRGGLWIWCSQCRTYLHGSIYVRKGWENSTIVDKNKLTAYPDYLDEIHDAIDIQVNTVKKKF